MEIGVLDNLSYRSVQQAQSAYILALRDLARIDPISIACLFKITKQEAIRLAETSVLSLEQALHNSPPILCVSGTDRYRGVSPMSALLDSLNNSQESFQNTAAHINAYSGQVNHNAVQTSEKRKKVG